MQDMSAARAMTQGMSEADAATHLAEKHEQMIRNEQAHGREIPRVPVSQSVVGEETARIAVEASQRSMHRATRKTFVVPYIPFLHGKKEQ
jgi:hypothetical protein